MKIKNDGKLAALLAASEARARGEKLPAGKANDNAWQAIDIKELRAKDGNTASNAVARKNLQMRILGIDTALRKTGWAVIDVAGHTMRAVDCGVIINSPHDSLTACMRHLSQSIRELLEIYKPDEATIEGGFYCENARTAIILGTARGAVLSVLATAGLNVYEYAPRRAKQCVTGKGNAAKEQVAAMVSNILNIRVSNLANDSTDAFALAICHASALMNPTVKPESPI